MPEEICTLFSKNCGSIFHFGGSFKGQNKGLPLFCPAQRVPRAGAAPGRLLLNVLKGKKIGYSSLWEGIIGQAQKALEGN